MLNPIPNSQRLWPLSFWCFLAEDIAVHACHRPTTMQAWPDRSHYGPVLNINRLYRLQRETTYFEPRLLFLCKHVHFYHFQLYWHLRESFEAQPNVAAELMLGLGRRNWREIFDLILLVSALTSTRLTSKADSMRIPNDPSL